VVSGGVELAGGIMEEEAIGEKKKKKKKRKREEKSVRLRGSSFSFFSLLLLSQRIYNSDEINDLGAGGCDFNPESLSVKRHYEEKELA
jgi:hypothetical protein